MTILAALAFLVPSPTVPFQDFGPIQVIEPGTKLVRSILAVDLDQDGDQDLIITSQSTYGVTWYQNIGGNNFLPPATISTDVKLPMDTAAADLDGDGDLDVLTADATSNQFAWYEQLAGTSFGAKNVIHITFGSSPDSVTTADLDGDGDPDIIGTTSALQGGAFWIENLGGGAFGAFTRFDGITGRVEDLLTADLDGDGDIDVIVAETWDQFAWFANRGDGTFGPKTMLATASGATTIAVADLDSDGDLDVVYGAYISGSVNAITNDGGGLFGHVETITTGITWLGSTVLGDIDGDGDVDILWNESNGKTLNWSPNLGGFKFGPPQLVDTFPEAPAPFVLGDIDGDGDGDPIVGTFGAPALFWLDSFPAFIDCNGNGVDDWIDIASGTSTDNNSNGIPDECDPIVPSLKADTSSISLTSGGTQVFEFDAPVKPLIATYLLMGTTSGTSPGVVIDGFQIPLNIDAYTLFSAQNPSTPPLIQSLGLVVNGKPLTLGAPPSFSIAPASDPSLIGLTIHHAYVTLDLVTNSLLFVSNAVPLTFTP